MKPVKIKTLKNYGIIMALALILFGTFYPVPKKEINIEDYVYDSQWSENIGAKYVGGDAYNYQMEASLKAGYISGIMAMKAITYTGGFLLLFFSQFAYAIGESLETQKSVMLNIPGYFKTQEHATERISKIIINKANMAKMPEQLENE